MNSNAILTWHHQPWQLLSESKLKNRLPHALLLAGASFLEKKQFVQQLSEAFLCKQPTQDCMPCGECHACHLVQAGSHPDLLWVEPEEAGGMIKVDQIRGLIESVRETSMQGGLRIIVINPAHAMNVIAANALLKTLEEPAPHTLLILLSDQDLRLPATIRSRCQKITFHKPPFEAARVWLASKNLGQDSALLLSLTEGLPLEAEAMVLEGRMAERETIYQGLYAMSQGKQDPLAFAVECQDFSILELLKFVQLWIRDLMRFKLTQGQADLINVDYQMQFAEISKYISIENSVKYLDLVQTMYGDWLNRFNLNKQLLLETCWITWARYVSC